MSFTISDARILLVGSDDDATARLSNALISAGGVVQAVTFAGEGTSGEWASVTPRRVEHITREAWQASCREALHDLERCDWLLHVAGRFQPLVDPTTAAARLEIDVQRNCLTGVYALELVLPPFLERPSGRIIALTSLAAICSTPSTAPYAASTMAWATYLESLRPPLGLRGIPINTIFARLSDLANAADQAQAVMPRFLKALERDNRETYLPWRAGVGPRVRRQLPAFFVDTLVDDRARAGRHPVV